jgi:hypothetical protein
MKLPNKALHRTAIPLRSIAAGELGRWVAAFVSTPNTVQWCSAVIMIAAPQEPRSNL